MTTDNEVNISKVVDADGGVLVSNDFARAVDISSTTFILLSPAEQRHLQELNNRVIAAQEELVRFIQFLRDQHDAPEDKWELNDLKEGFREITVLE